MAKIKDLPKEQRPREKLLKYGAEKLTREQKEALKTLLVLAKNSGFSIIRIAQHRSSAFL